ncbi:AMP-binding protein [Streptomyces sp. NPDC058316]|uniref:AMP-binding enzyme n=1 Tax=unclassified Streptomyces TaxID=2593676 RepID=UPI00343BEEC1
MEDLADGTCELSHEALDRRTDEDGSLANDCLRAVLVAAGALTARDEHLARTERWVEQKIVTIEDPDHRNLVAAFVRWPLISGLRRRARGKPIRSTQVDYVRVSTFKAVAFLSFVKEHGETLGTCRQALVDLWLTDHDDQGNYSVRPFVVWAVKNKHAGRIRVPARPKAVREPTLDSDERWAIARRPLHDDSVDLKDRIAGLMVLLYAQKAVTICHLTTHVIPDDEGVSIKLQRIPLQLPAPLDGLVLQLVEQHREHRVVSKEQNAPWLFRAGLDRLAAGRQESHRDLRLAHRRAVVGHPGVHLPPADHVLGSPRLRAAGRPYPGIELKIIDVDGLPLPPGEVGEVCLKTPARMLEYWNLPEATGKTLVDGWVHTGDAGYLFIQDRIKEMIIRAGENIYPAEVENAISAHSAVLDVAVIGVPDDRWSEAVHAFVVLRPDASVAPHQLRAFLGDRLATFKIPTKYEFIDKVPRNPSGKILRRVLRDRFWTEHDRAVN